jgi:hypothetical protein
MEVPVSFPFNRRSRNAQYKDAFVLSSVTEGSATRCWKHGHRLPVVVPTQVETPRSCRRQSASVPVGGVQATHGETNRCPNQRDLRLELGQQAVRRMREEFSMESMAQNYDRVYNSLAPSSTGAKRGARWRWRRSQA